MPNLPGSGEWEVPGAFLFGTSPPFSRLYVDFERQIGTASANNVATPLTNLQITGADRFSANYKTAAASGQFTAVFNADRTLSIQFTGQVTTTATAKPVKVWLSTKLEAALLGLKATAQNFATGFINDEVVRKRYLRLINKYCKETREAVLKGEMSPKEGELAANQLRNGVMNATRDQTSELGLAYAKTLKKEGRALPELEAKYAAKKFSKTFEALSENEKNQVYLEIIEASGRDDIATTALVMKLGKLGRGLLVISLAIVIYNVATAEDKMKAVTREAVGLGGSVGGGVVGGALAGGGATLAGGWAAGPGYPIVVGIGVFAGGIAGAFGADFLFDWMNSSDDDE